jgi:hypothetical protein
MGTAPWRRLRAASEMRRRRDNALGRDGSARHAQDVHSATKRGRRNAGRRRQNSAKRCLIATLCPVELSSDRKSSGLPFTNLLEFVIEGLDAADGCSVDVCP